MEAYKSLTRTDFLGLVRMLSVDESLAFWELGMMLAVGDSIDLRNALKVGESESLELLDSGNESS